MMTGTARRPRRKRPLHTQNAQLTLFTWFSCFFLGGGLCVCLASSWVISLPVTFQLVRLAEIQFRDLVIEATPEWLEGQSAFQPITERH